MLRRLTCFCLFVLFVCAGITRADLVGLWTMDEGKGTIAADLSGNGNDGAFEGSPLWVPGQYGSALELDGSSWLNCGDAPQLEITGPLSIVCWINSGDLSTDRSFVSRNASYAFKSNGTHVRFTTPGILDHDGNNTIIETGVWAHVAVTFDPGQANGMVFYLNGVETDRLTASAINAGSGPVWIGNNQWGAQELIGQIDDLAIFNHILTAEEIQTVMQGLGNKELAAKPSPDDGADDVLRDSVLSWTPGAYAGTHNVYVGESLEDVDNATVPTSSGLDVNSFDPGRLDFGKTVFWRVDEVNATPDNTVFKGKVWSFEAEPYSVKLPFEAITVTASSVNNDTTEPNFTIDGSGLDADGMHSNEVADVMWMSVSGDPSPSLTYEFDDAHKLDKLLIWNSNHSSEAVIGWGIKDVEIQHSLDGLDWTLIPEPSQLTRGPGFVPNEAQVVDMGLVQAKYVRLNILNNWGGLLPQYGVAEVQFYALPMVAREPMPASGAVDVPPNAVVSWRGGREADQHTVYVDMDPNAVADGLASSVSSSTNSQGLASLDLGLGQTYYWRVDEVNDTEVPSVWAGPVWSLSTSTSLVVDDFESYSNISPNRPFQHWLDGFGYSPDEFFPVEYLGNGTGSGIGHDIWSVSSPYFDGSIMETDSTIAGSSQSMPFYYTNTGGTASQTERVFAVSQDWTVGGVKTLSIAFRGQAGNTGTLYAKINDAKITYDRDPGNIAHPAWQAWNIDLTTVNTALQNVTKLVIGVEGNGAAGMLLIDDIRLHPEAGELLTPVDPGNNGLAALYTFEGNFDDSSGNGRHGTVVGTLGVQVVQDPIRGQVLSLPGGADQFVEVGAVGISGAMPRTIACWAKAASTDIPEWSLIFGFTGQEDASGDTGSHFNIGSLGGPGGIGAHVWGWEETMVSDQDGLNWHHYAMTYDGTTIAYFVDGVPMDSDPGKSNEIDLTPSADRVHIGSRVTQTSSFPGNVDDAVIYDRVLSVEEILYLADMKAPIDKPF